MATIDPIAFKVGTFGIHWYGIMMALAFLASLASCIYLGKKIGRDAAFMSDLITWIMISSIVGARLAYVLANLDYFSGSPFSVFYIWKGGLIYYGGFAGAAVGILLFARLRGEKLLRLYDIVAVALPFSHALGRIGCFLNGCCFGRPTHWITGVACPLNSEVGMAHFHAKPPLVTERHVRDLMEQLDLRSQQSVDHFRYGIAALLQNGTITGDQAMCLPVHPVQLYEAALNIVLSFGLLWFYHKKKLDGSVVATYMLVYAAIRFCMEFLRGDERMMLGGLTVAQVVSVMVFAGGAAGWIWLLNRERTNPGSSTGCRKTAD